MKASIFRKKVTPRNGSKTFYKYVTSLPTKEGDIVYCDVVLDDDIEIEKFPITVTFSKSNANLRTKHYNVKNSVTGELEERSRYILYLKAIDNTEPYIDTSLDKFKD